MPRTVLKSVPAHASIRRHTASALTGAAIAQLQPEVLPQDSQT